MTSLQDFLPQPGSSNWRQSRTLTTDGDDDTTVRHVVIREVWLEKQPWPHAVYKIDVMSQTSHWFVFKRYKEFYNLHQKLVKLYRVPRDLLPPRKIANNMARETLESRRLSLEHYLQKLLNRVQTSLSVYGEKVSCNGTVRKSQEISEFLDVKSHDVVHVTYNLAKYFKQHGQSILMSKDFFNMSPSQLYCVTKQLQLPHPNGKNAVDLGYLYEFVSELKRLNIADSIAQLSNGEQHEISFSFDLSMFTSLKQLQMDACSIESLRGIESLRPKLTKLTARYCLSSMKALLIDAAIEKRSTPQISLSGESWRIQAAYKLSENRVVVKPWHVLTHINFSHNNITTLDSSMELLTSLKKLDLSHNMMTHLDLQLVTSPNLQALSLANNRIYLVSATTNPLDNLKNLNLSGNKVQNIDGLLCCHGLEDLNLSYNMITETSECKKLASLPNLSSLYVAGNHFAKKKRHRIILLAYFRNRQMLLDRKPMSQKEQAKLDAKFYAIENLEDMDDSISSISTVSDESDLDSGFGHSNWVSKLSALSEIDEDDFEVVPHVNCWEEGSDSSSQGQDNESIAHENEEILSRDDWDRILQNDTRERQQTGGSENTLEGRHNTLSTNDDSTIRNSTRTDSWLVGLFKRRSTISADEQKQEPSQIPNVIHEETLRVIPEIDEIKVQEEDIAHSFDENEYLEKAEECCDE